MSFSRISFAVLLSVVSVPVFASPDLSQCESWNPAASCNYTVSSRPSSYPISYMIIHKAEGSASGSAAWMQNCSSGVSAHYNIDNNNGYCYQSLREKDVGWHAANWSTNCRSIGIEHGGYTARNDNSAAMYAKSALVTKHAIAYYGLPYDRNHIIGHIQVPGATHTDPGSYWDWNYYMSVCNPNPAPSIQAYVPPVFANDQNGALEVFARKSDNNYDKIYQSGGQWSAWGGMGIGGQRGMKMVRNADGRLEAFVVKTDGSVWHSWQTAPNSGWSSWVSLGGWVSMIAVGKNSDGRLEVFAIAGAGDVCHCWQTSAGGGFSGWQSLGGVVSQIDLATNADGRLEIFAIGGGSHVFHNWQTSSGWSGWADLGGVVKQMAIGRNPDGRLEVFVIAAAGDVCHCWQQTTGGWSGWATLGGSSVSQLTLATNNDGGMELFVIGGGNAVYRNRQTSVWSGWQSLGGVVNYIGVGKNADGRLELFAVVPGQDLCHCWQNAAGGSWSGWGTLGGTSLNSF